MLRAIEIGYPQNKNFDDACRFQRQLEAGEMVKVGFNRFREKENGRPLKVYRADPKVEGQRIKNVQELRRNRDNARVERALANLKRLAAMPPSESGNLMPHLVEAVGAYATVGEILYDAARSMGRVQRAGRSLSGTWRQARNSHETLMRKVEP